MKVLRLSAERNRKAAPSAGGDGQESNSIEVFIHFLRKKFSPKLIVTVRGKGYRIGSEEVILDEMKGRESESA